MGIHYLAAKCQPETCSLVFIIVVEPSLAKFFEYCGQCLPGYPDTGVSHRYFQETPPFRNIRLGVVLSWYDPGDCNGLCHLGPHLDLPPIRCKFEGIGEKIAHQAQELVPVYTDQRKLMLEDGREPYP